MGHTKANTGTKSQNLGTCGALHFGLYRISLYFGLSVQKKKEKRQRERKSFME